MEKTNKENERNIFNDERKMAIVMKNMIDMIQDYEELDDSCVKEFITREVGLTNVEFDQIDKLVNSKSLIENIEQPVNIQTTDVQGDVTVSWEMIKASFDFRVIREQALKYSRLEFNSIEEIEEEFDESDMFNLCNMIINSCTISK